MTGEYIVTVNILIPVYNEERRVEKGVRTANAFMQKMFPTQYRITVVDNASTDGTCKIMQTLQQKLKNVFYLRISEKGVGAALRAGVKENECDIVGYMDVDLSTDLKHISEMLKIFELDTNVTIVNGSRLSSNSYVTGRKKVRRITSYGLKYLLKLVFGMKINDAICGFKFFRKETIQKLMEVSSNEPGWFYCIELLLRAERMGFKIKEIPVMWQDDYDTTVHVKKLIINYLKCIWRLKQTFHREDIQKKHETI